MLPESDGGDTNGAALPSHEDIALRLSTPATGMRRLVLEAAARVIRERGPAGATTRAIAESAGVSEGTIYNHFRDKLDLLLAVLSESLPNFTAVSEQLRPGEGSVDEQLVPVARAAIAFYREMWSTIGLLGEVELVDRMRSVMRERNVGPHLALEGLARYLEGEQQLGRVNTDADPYVMARLLLGACYQQAFLDRLVGADMLQTPPDTLPEDLVRNLVAGLGVTAEAGASAPPRDRS